MLCFAEAGTPIMLCMWHSVVGSAPNYQFVEVVLPFRAPHTYETMLAKNNHGFLLRKLEFELHQGHGGHCLGAPTNGLGALEISLLFCYSLTCDGLGALKCPKLPFYLKWPWNEYPSKFVIQALEETQAHRDYQSPLHQCLTHFHELCLSK